MKVKGYIVRFDDGSYMNCDGMFWRCLLTFDRCKATVHSIKFLKSYMKTYFMPKTYRLIPVYSKQDAPKNNID